MFKEQRTEFTKKNITLFNDCHYNNTTPFNILLFGLSFDFNTGRYKDILTYLIEETSE